MVAPVRIDDELVHAVGGWLVTVTPFVAGRQADISVAADARLLGRTLGELHSVLAGLGTWQLHPVASLDRDDRRDRSRRQLLHGDFSDQNLIVTSSGVRVFDFDDCGYGPALHHVTNLMYMVMFDADVHDDHDRYATFRPPFVEGYAETTGAAVDTAVDTAVVDALIAARIDALGRWLDDPIRAPIGIRSSSPEWQQVLRAFVAAHIAPDASDPV